MYVKETLGKIKKHICGGSSSEVRHIFGIDQGDIAGQQGLESKIQDNGIYKTSTNVNLNEDGDDGKMQA